MAMDGASWSRHWALQLRFPLQFGHSGSFQLFIAIRIDTKHTNRTIHHNQMISTHGSRMMLRDMSTKYLTDNMVSEAGALMHSASHLPASPGWCIRAGSCRPRTQTFRYCSAEQHRVKRVQEPDWPLVWLIRFWHDDEATGSCYNLEVIYDKHILWFLSKGFFTSMLSRSSPSMLGILGVR
jgi:hypothetical protein